MHISPAIFVEKIALNQLGNFIWMITVCYEKYSVGLSLWNLYGNCFILWLQNHRIFSSRGVHATALLSGETELSLLLSFELLSSIIILRWRLCRFMCSLLSSCCVLNWYCRQQCPLLCVRVHSLIISSISGSVIIILHTATGSVNRCGGWAGAKTRADQRPRFGHKTKPATASSHIFWS